MQHSCFYKIAEITLQIRSGIPISDATFADKFLPFAVQTASEDCIELNHYFDLPAMDPDSLGKLVYQRAPWRIYRKGSSWLYMGYLEDGSEEPVYQVAAFSENHTYGRIYNGENQEKAFRAGEVTALTLMPTDQILLARLR